MKFLVVLALFAAASAEPEAEADPCITTPMEPQLTIHTLTDTGIHTTNMFFQQLKLLKSNQLSTPTHTTMEDTATLTLTTMPQLPCCCKTIHLLRQQWWSRPYCQET